MAASLRRFLIEVAPLQETEYTGIPQVTAKLCEQLLGDATIEPGFFYGRQMVPIDIISHGLKERNGSLLRWASERYLLQAPLPSVRPDDMTVGLHTNMKFARRVFPVEGQIIHDLTTVVTPHFHTEQTNLYHQEKFYGDLMSNDVNVCVSESTAFDLKTFYPGLPGSVVVSHLGVDWDHVDQSIRDTESEVENYVFVLGTLEPRKNVEVVLDLLAKRPQLARMYRFVFGGRVGWGNAFEKQVEERGLGRLLEEKRIVKVGFVNESAKYLLLKFAAAVIYPSLYEGFGLPVAEALSFGTPVVMTASSSLPEVGRDFAHYFVPHEVDSLGRALTAALRQGRVDQSRTGETLEAWRNYFSWPRCYTTIRDGLFDAASEIARRRDVHH